ncbi:hypothetical protein TNCV_2616331 [Trichonephila clavipes]|nr:hypothetical protein TNCV_2616331 [Trichonephila clavipes]
MKSSHQIVFMNGLNVSGKGRLAWKSPPILRAGRPKTIRTQKNIERVKQIEKNDCRLIKRMIAEKLGIGTESVFASYSLRKESSAADAYSIV